MTLVYTPSTHDINRTSIRRICTFNLCPVSRGKILNHNFMLHSLRLSTSNSKDIEEWFVDVKREKHKRTNINLYKGRKRNLIDFNKKLIWWNMYDIALLKTKLKNYITDRRLCKLLVNACRHSVAFHIENNNLFDIANQMTLSICNAAPRWSELIKTDGISFCFSCYEIFVIC